MNALAKLQGGGSVSIYNLGNRRRFSVKELVASGEYETVKVVRLKFGCRRAGDPGFLVSDARRAQ